MDTREITVDAKVSELQDVQAFIEEALETHDCPMKTMMQIGLAVEEIFVNIAHYAYKDGEDGKAKVEVSVCDGTLIITFSDSGIPYDPLAKEDPDVTAAAEDREIGGLGIFLTKKVMDDVAYEYKDGNNILKLTKKI